MDKAPAPAHDQLLAQLDLDRQPGREVRDQRFAFALAQIRRIPLDRGLQPALRHDQVAARIAALLQRIREHEVRLDRIRCGGDLRVEARIGHAE